MPAIGAETGGTAPSAGTIPMTDQVSGVLPAPGGCLSEGLPFPAGSIRIIEGDCIASMATLPAASFQCCVTSPPYYGLRDYGHAGQIGLEPSPAEYVARMVDVFREVRRVLRDDGTLWLNVGDSYAAGQSNNGGYSEKSTLAGFTNPNTKGRLANSAAEPRRLKHGHKPKDLLGIPWQLAFALRQPYYAGRIKREIDRVWLAAMVDGEGCFYIHRRPAGQHAGDGYHRTQDNYQAAFEVANTCEAIVARCMQIAGCGSITRQDKDRRQPLYRWTVRSNEARALAREIYPYLVAKQQQARLICGTPPSGKPAEAAWGALKVLHGGSTSDVNFAAPEPMLEPGWYLRSDVIWSKPNPMPESVTDRPTSAHEHVFLLTKSARYFYDAEAVREPISPHNEGVISVSPLGDHRMAEGARRQEKRQYDVIKGANARNVWTIATQPYSGAHFATMPPDLAERCIKAGTRPGDHVLDPFGGAGTTGLVADRLGRRATLCELNPAYAALARNRIRDDAPLFGSVA